MTKWWNLFDILKVFDKTSLEYFSSYPWYSKLYRDCYFATKPGYILDIHYYTKLNAPHYITSVFMDGSEINALSSKIVFYINYWRSLTKKDVNWFWVWKKSSFHFVNSKFSNWKWDLFDQNAWENTDWRFYEIGFPKMFSIFIFSLQLFFQRLFFQINVLLILQHTP